MNSLEYCQYYFEDFLKTYIRDQKFNKYYCKELQEAIAYSLLNPGKRIRPSLMFSIALSLTNLSKEQVLKKCLHAALAIEFVHTYSLIHDDLPCMDNDDYRRNKPSLHKKFNEALAILAGDALLSDSFSMLCLSKHSASLCKELANCIGSKGLVAGQVMDICKNNQYHDVTTINEAKTALLFSSTCVMAGICMQVSSEHLNLCRKFGLSYGLWFQTKDDMQDQEKYTQTHKIKFYQEDLINNIKKFPYAEYLKRYSL